MYSAIPKSCVSPERDLCQREEAMVRVYPLAFSADSVSLTFETGDRFLFHILDCPIISI